MGRPRKVDTSKVASQVSEPTEDALREELTGTGTGAYDTPQPAIRQAMEDVGAEEEFDPNLVRQTGKQPDKSPISEVVPPAELFQDEEPVKPVVPQEDPYKTRYEESVKWNTRLSQDIADNKRALDALRAEIAKPKEQVPQYTREQLMEWRDRDPDQYYQWQAQQIVDQRTKQIEERVSGLHSAMSGILAKSEADRFASEHQDFNTMTDEIRQELQGMPSEMTTNPQYYRQALNLAYWSVKGRKNIETQSQLRESGTREIANRNALKRDLYTERGSNKTFSEPTIDLKFASSKEIYNYMKKQGLVPQD